MDLKSEILIFTDGSSRGNPGPGGFGAVIAANCQLLAVREERENPNKICIVEIGDEESHTTNNRMELQAAISALSFLQKLAASNLQLTAYSDSSYLVNGITKWVWGWQKNGWKTKTKQPVENQDLWESLIKVSAGKKIAWKLVGGHIGVAGNERCDEIATGFADNRPPNLYSGPLEKYPVKNILDVTQNASNPPKFSGRKLSKARAYSYVSLVGGAVKIHKTWAGCERRVKGKSGAKFKKVFSADEEVALIDEWQ